MPDSMPLPPGATLVSNNPPPMALPAGATLVSDNAPSEDSDKTIWGRIKAALKPQGAEAMSGLSHDQYSAALKNTNMPGSTEGPGMLQGLSDYDKASGGEIGGGIHDIYQGNVAKGLHRVLSGVMAGSTPVASLALPAAAAAAPVSTGLSIAGGIAGQKVAQSGAEALGASPDQAALAGDVGGLAGGALGGAIPRTGAKALLLGKTPEEAYQSALKPSTTIKPDRVENMVQTGLQNQIPVSKGGIEKLGSLLDDLHDQVTQGIGAGQGKSINKFAVASRLSDTAKDFANQVNPEADLEAVSKTGNEFLRNQPGQIPAADAQALKVGTYRQLGNKAYGELGSATIESQKALARGIKEELETQFPELHDLNAAEGSLYDLKPVLEKAVQRQGNHQILGIGTPIAAGGVKAITGSSKLAAVAGAIKAVVDNPIVKSHLAIALDKAGVSPGVADARIQAYVGGLAASAANSGSDESQSTPQQH